MDHSEERASDLYEVVGLVVLAVSVDLVDEVCVASIHMLQIRPVFDHFNQRHEHELLQSMKNLPIPNLYQLPEEL